MSYIDVHNIYVYVDESPVDPCMKNLYFEYLNCWCFFKGKGGKNRRRGKNENETEKRELVFKEDGQGMLKFIAVAKVFRKLKTILQCYFALSGIDKLFVSKNRFMLN